MLEEFLDKNHALFEQHYIPIKIDTAKMTHGREVAGRLGKPERSGIPWLVILNAQEEKLITSDGPKGNIGHPYEPHEIEYFLTMLRSTAKDMSEEHLAKIEQALIDAAKALKEAAEARKEAEKKSARPGETLNVPES